MVILNQKKLSEYIKLLQDLVKKRGITKLFVHSSYHLGYFDKPVQPVLAK
jgi:hypothetical protein